MADLGNDQATSHGFAAPTNGKDACTVCGWEREAHAPQPAEAEAGTPPGAAVDASWVAMIDTCGACGGPMYEDASEFVHCPACEARERGGEDVIEAEKVAPEAAAPELPLGVRPELHHDRPVSDHQLRFTGKASIVRANRLHDGLWEELRIGHVGMLSVAYEVTGDGHQTIKDRDGDVVGLAEIRKLKIGAVALDPLQDDEDGLPLFEQARLNLRPGVRAFAEEIERQLRTWEEGDEPRVTLGTLETAVTRFTAELTYGSRADVMLAGAVLGAEVYQQLLYSDADRAALAASAARCGVCQHDLMAHGRTGCETAHLVLMGDGEERPERCACSGFRDVGEEAEKDAGSVEGWGEAFEARSLLDEALAVASACGAIHRGHLSPCPVPAGECDLPRDASEVVS